MKKTKENVPITQYFDTTELLELMYPQAQSEQIAPIKKNERGTRNKPKKLQMMNTLKISAHTQSKYVSLSKKPNRMSRR